MKLTIFGRTDDGADALLRHPSGQVIRWPDPDKRLDDQGHALLTFTPGRTYSVRRAGSYVFFRSTDVELCLPFFELMPALPQRAEILLEPIPAEENEGVDRADESYRA